ncbi:MAG TPA: Gfo/Idh/MocA family oxidoreductase [Gemmataceae bacterium]|jgi:predicted dehydrogenase|nr:Gfo/Idh/MocA family oxidoreductase [Gemmataceae bacterium]
MGLAAMGLPLWYAREALAYDQEVAFARAKKIGANDKIQVGVIGSGDRFKGGLLGDVKRHPAFVIVACCDVDKKHVNGVADLAQKHYKNEVARYGDFREISARKDIDAMVVATPDHWHALAAIEAMKNKKDVYCEKPLTLTINEGKAMLKVARANDVVFQVGSQQRSDLLFRFACELVRNKRLGELKHLRIETRIGDNPQGGPFKQEQPPAELDYNFWLGQVPEAPYCKERVHYQFRWWQDYSGGKMTDWGAHHNDIAQWALGMDGNGPVSVDAMGYPIETRPLCYNHPRNFEITYAYANGAELTCMAGDPRYDALGHQPALSRQNGVLFIGKRPDPPRKGAPAPPAPWIFVDRGNIHASHEGLLVGPLGANATRLEVSGDHMGNWLDCIRSRKRPICDIEIGHRSVTVCHLGNIALKLKRKLKWDPAKEEFDGDDEANGMLSREMRSPWKLEV